MISECVYWVDSEKASSEYFSGGAGVSVPEIILPGSRPTPTLLGPVTLDHPIILFATVVTVS